MENEFYTVHFEYLHGVTIIPFLSRLYKLKVINYKWKICNKPNTHCSQSDTVDKIEAWFFIHTAIRNSTFVTVGPAIINIQINTLFNIKIFDKFSDDNIRTFRTSACYLDYT